ncbi:hypothetical protein EDC01DRAFT_510490 [Geopyxis carbonaria]|nr:hypothetical protein EDC01DRAFT_510490 [Geopyxis carbonaria]
MASASPKATRMAVTPQRGRGRGRPRLYARGTSSALSGRNRTPASAQKVLETPTNRRRTQPNAGYRPGGAGGGGRYIDPDTGEEIPASIYRDMHKKRTPRTEAGTPTTVRRAPQPPPPPQVGPDGVYKPREERSYTEFHPGFEVNQVLYVFSAEEIDGDNYKPSTLEHKTVKIIDVKEEEDLRKEDANVQDEDAMFDGENQMSKIATPEFTELPSINGILHTTNSHIMPNLSISQTTPMYPIHMEDVHGMNDIPLDPALAALTPPPPITDPFPIDPALAEDSQPALAQTHTPAATPTDGPLNGPVKEEIVQPLRISPPPATPAVSTKREKEKDEPTLASRRPHRLNAGKPPPRSAPNASTRKPRNQNQNPFGDEKLNLRAPSYREIQPFKYSDVAWNSQIGSTGAYGLNNPSSFGSQFSETMINLGYQSSSNFYRPETLFRDFPDPGVDEELGCIDRDMVEYDMDEQDDKWLVTYNSHRILDNSSVSREIFEIAMTKIEKEWVGLERRIPKIQAKPHGAGMSNRRRSAGRPGEEDDDEGAEDSKCAICDDGECENANAIVFCDGCNLAVHQECYGVPYIPEGQWHCRKCQQIPRQTANCVFCPNTDGAFKQTTTNRWAHLLCAIWIPEIRLANPAFMEPVEGIESVPKSRWKLSCYICKQKMGACIQCSNKSCFIAFHVTCGRRGRLHMKMKNSSGPGAQLESSGLKAYCDKHVPLDWRAENDVDNAIIDAMDFYAKELSGREWGDSQATAVAGHQDDGFLMQRANPKIGERRKRLFVEQPKTIWKLPSGAPVIPNVLYSKVAEYMSRFDIKGVKDFTAEVCKYWTLKREARRGACLIRRLQIQADSNSFTSLEVARKNYAAMGHSQGTKKLERRKEFATVIEQDLAGLMQIMTDKNWRSQDILAKEADMLKNYVDAVYFPELPLMRKLLADVQQLDHNKNFQHGFGLIADQIEHRLYPSVAAFAVDIRSVLRSPINDPHLAFDIRVQGYVSPTFIKSQKYPEPGADVIAKDRERILGAFERLFPQSITIEKELLAQMQERPASRVRSLQEVEQVNGAAQLRDANGVDVRPYSPSAQLAKESSAEKPRSTLGDMSSAVHPANSNSVLGKLVPAIAKTMNRELLNRQIPHWFVNNYRSHKIGGIPSEPDYHVLVNTMNLKLEKLSAAQSAAPSPIPSPAPTIESAIHTAPTEMEEASLPPQKTESVEPPTVDSSVNDMDVDNDMEDAPGEVDEDFLPPPCPEVPENESIVVDIQPQPQPHIHSDLHDEDAEGEIDDEMPLAPPFDCVPVPSLAIPFTPSVPVYDPFPAPGSSMAQFPDSLPVPIAPPPPPPAISQLPQGSFQPRLSRPRFTENDAALHEDIRNDDDLLGGYRAEDLPSPLGVIGDTISTPTTPKAPNGAAMASNPASHVPQHNEEHDIMDLPSLPHHSFTSDKQENLEIMTNTSVLSDYPDELDADELEIVKNIKNIDEDAEGEEDIDGSINDTTPSPSSSSKRSTPRKGSDFKRDSIGRFERNKGYHTRSPTRARRRKKT